MFRKPIIGLKGFNKFYNELKYFLQNDVIDPEYLTTLFFFIENVFPQHLIEKDERLAREKKEISILTVNQVNMNFDNARIIDLAFAAMVASQGKDQVFKHKFLKKIASKLAIIDTENPPKVSFRCLLQLMAVLAPSSEIGNESWNTIVKLCDMNINKSRQTLDKEEIISLLQIMFSRQSGTNTMLDAVFKDLSAIIESGKLDYNDIYEIIITLYSHKINAISLVEVIMEYYVQKGYDEDELSLLGNAKACKFLKAISEMHHSPSTQFSGLFMEACFNFIKNNYQEFTTMQLKRAMEFMKAMDYFKDSEDEMVIDTLSEVKKLYKEKVTKSMAKHHGLDMMMTENETTIEVNDEEDIDPVFEEDQSEQEEEDEDEKIDRFIQSKKVHPVQEIIRQNDVSKLPKSHPNMRNTEGQFKDPRIKRITEMVDQGYKKYGKDFMKPKK